VLKEANDPIQRGLGPASKSLSAVARVGSRLPRGVPFAPLRFGPLLVWLLLGSLLSIRLLLIRLVRILTTRLGPAGLVVSAVSLLGLRSAFAASVAMLCLLRNTLVVARNGEGNHATHAYLGSMPHDRVLHAIGSRFPSLVGVAVLDAGRA
jgi:hypothetical protein